MSCARVHVVNELCKFCGSLHTAQNLTVGVLRSILAGLDDSDQVLIGALNGDWQNVAGVQIPDGDSYLSLTLFASDTYDSRQF